jgi:hypothetical protein
MINLLLVFANSLLFLFSFISATLKNSNGQFFRKHFQTDLPILSPRTDRKFNRMRPSMAGFFGRSDLVEICSLSAHSIQEARMPQASGLHSRRVRSPPQRHMGCAVLVTN